MSKSQMRMVPSALPQTSQLPSGAVATAGGDGAPRTGQHLLLFPGGRIPDPCRPVLAARHQPVGIRCCCDRGHSAVMAAQHEPRQPSGRIPDVRGPVAPPEASQLPSGAVATTVMMDPALPALAAVPRWPHPADPCRPVPAAGNQPAVVCGRCDCGDRLAVAGTDPLGCAGRIRMRTVPSAPPDASQLPSCAVAAAVMAPATTGRSVRCLSPEVSPTGAEATPTAVGAGLTMPAARPEAACPASHIRAVPSSWPDRDAPPGHTAAAMTAPS